MQGGVHGWEALPSHGGAEGEVSTNVCLVRAAGGISDSLRLEEG